MLRKAWRVLWVKFLNKTSKYLLVLLNALLMPLILLLAMVVRFSRNYRVVERNGILLTGLDSLASKTIRRLNLYAIHMPVRVATYESKLNQEYPKRIILKGLVLLDLFRTIRVIKKFGLHAIEIYMSGPLLYQVVLCWIFRRDLKLVVVFRGELYYYYTRMTFLERLAVQKIAKYSDLVLYRETYMRQIIDKWNLETQLVFDPNSTEVKPLMSKTYSGEVLFLNGFKVWRNLEVLLRAVPIVASNFPSVKFTIIGARSEYELSKYKAMVDKSCKSNVNLKMWSKNAARAYDDASIFILPADLVYLNFSLLEAMERGLAPIISNVDDVAKIIEDGNSGLIVKNRDSLALANAICELLEDKDKLQQIGQAARQVIINKFNDVDRVKNVVNYL